MFAHEFHLKAEAASNLGRFSEAKLLAVQAIAADPENGDGYASLGRALLGLDKPKEAELQFRAALERNAERSWYLRCLAISLKVQNRLREALPLANKLVELYPSDFESFETRAKVRLMSKKHADAIADFRIAVSLNPNAEESHAGLGDSFLGKKQYREAEIHYRKALSIRPTWAYALNNLGVCLERQGKLKEAALAYKTAVLVDPQLQIAKENTKSVLDRYLGVGIGSIAFLLWCIVKLATTASLSTSADSLLLMIFTGAVGVLALLNLYLYCQKLDRKNELALDDPELLEIYEKIKQEKQK